MRLPNFECLGCGAQLDGATSMTKGDVPTPGSVSVCLYCENVAVFTETGLRPPTSEERRKFAASPKVQLAKAAVRSVRKRADG